MLNSAGSLTGGRTTMIVVLYCVQGVEFIEYLVMMILQWLWFSRLVGDLIVVSVILGSKAGAKDST